MNRKPQGLEISKAIVGFLQAKGGKGRIVYLGRSARRFIWREFGVLPEHEFGKWCEDLGATQYRRMSQSNGELPFEPTQYPPKSRKKTRKSPKPKSTKPRYLDQSSTDNDSHWIRDRIEE